jgi:hypothetical protein
MPGDLTTITNFINSPPQAGWMISGAIPFGFRLYITQPEVCDESGRHLAKTPKC